MLFSKNERKFRKAYNDYYPLVFNYILTKVGIREDSEEICHNIFVDLHKKLNEVNDIRNWLMAAVRFGITNYYRNKENKRKDTVDIEQNIDSKFLVSENGDSEIQIIIKEALQNENNFKNEKERILFELIAINNYSYSQAAKQLGMTKRQAEYKFIMASKRILKYLNNKGIKRIEDLL